MDIISSYQLRQYEDILDEINSEFEKSERLKREIQEADDTITFLKLSLSPCQKKISHVNVKIFGSVTEISNLYDELGDCSNVLDASKCNNCNFFLIEVILTKTLLDKLSNMKWKLQIVIRAENFCISKVVPVSDRSSIMEVVAVDDNVLECAVDVHLFYNYESDWITLDLCSVSVDISYYFESYKEKHSHASLVDNFLNITKLYNNATILTYISRLPNVQNQFKCSFDKHNFVPTFVKNSYHRLNLESFSEIINDNRRAIELQFSASNTKILTLYHKDTNILKLKCSPCIIQMVRKYFEQYLSSDVQEFRTKVKNIKRKKTDLEDMDLDELLSFYQQLRRLWL